MKELSSIPQLRQLSENASPLPLEHTRVLVYVVGLTAAVKVYQRFRNPLTAKADLEYLFPLPHEAAITAFELRTGERVITASVQELEQAVQQFERARQAGRKAGLLDTRRPDLFGLQLANIQPGEFIEAVTSYQERLKFSSGQVEFVFPMGLTPRYHRNEHPEEAQGVDAPVTFETALVGDVEISLEIDPGLLVAEPTSPSHPIRVTAGEKLGFTVSLAAPHIPDHDFVLRWKISDEDLQFPAWQLPGSVGYFMATLLPPMPKAGAAPIPREYIFVMDRSGSMSGDPIRQAVNALKACLRSLNPQDTFGILLFDDRLEWLSHARRVTQAAIDQVDRHLNQVDGRGGTEIIPALNAALSLPADPKRSRLVVFLTDGAISAEKDLLSNARKRISQTRLFTFGIGPSVNRAVLIQLANLGAGQAEFIGLDEDIEDAILRFQDRIAFPMLTNLSLSAEGGRIWDVYPARLPDLYAGVPLEVVGRCQPSGDAPFTLILNGRRGELPVEMRVVLSEPAADPTLLPRLWSRARVDDLLEGVATAEISQHGAREEIIALALKYNLLTSFTAFLAIDNQADAIPGEAHFIPVSHPLPQGLAPSGFWNLPHGQLAAPQFKTQSSYQEDLDIPVFLRNRRAAPSPSPAKPKRKARAVKEPTRSDDIDLPTVFGKDSGVPSIPHGPVVTYQPTPGPEPLQPIIHAAQILQEMARIQRLDGSWDDDVEVTAAALIAFVRNGHTTAIGHFRKQVARAFAWLSQASTQGFPAFLRALALHELAALTRVPEHLSAAQQAIQALPDPANNLEAVCDTVLNQTMRKPKPPKYAATMDQLRLALVGQSKNTRVAPPLLEVMLGRLLAAGISGKEE